MSTSTTEQTRAATDNGLEELEIHEALRDLAKKAGGRQNLYREATRLIAQHFDAPYGAISVDTSSGCFEDHIKLGNVADQRWQTLCSGLLLDARYRRMGIAKIYDSVSLGMSFATMAAPIVEEGHGTVGSLVVVTVVENKAQATSKLSELKALVSLLSVLASPAARAQETAGSQSQADLSGAAKAGSYLTLQEFAFAMANGLKSKLECEQVSLGIVHGSKVKVLCMSGLDDLYPRSPGSGLIRQAMSECRDAEEPICFQTTPKNDWDDSQTNNYFLHKKWHDETGNSCVASIPFFANERCVLILSLRNRSERAFRREEIDKIKEMITPLIPGVTLLQKSERSFLRHSLDSLANFRRTWFGRNAILRQIFLLAIVALACWSVIGTREFVVTVPCEVVPQQSRQIAAPVDGTLTHTYVQGGARVSKGQLLLQFDTADLELEKKRIQSQIRIAELEITQALDLKDHAAAAQASAKIEMAKAELALVERKITSSTVRAPSDGVILSGDIEFRRGEVVAMGTPLLDFAATDQWSLDLMVPQFSACHLQSGQDGVLAITAQPDKTIHCKLTKQPIASSVVDGKHVFVTEADLDGANDWLRPGMTGVAKINAGQKRIWWVAVHRIVDCVRLWLWNL